MFSLVTTRPEFTLTLKKAPFGSHRAKRLSFSPLYHNFQSLWKKPHPQNSVMEALHIVPGSPATPGMQDRQPGTHGSQLGPWIEIPDISFPQPLMFAWSKLDRPDSPADLVGLAGLAGIAGPAAN